MPSIRRRAFKDIITLIRHLLESNTDYCSASYIGGKISADPRTVEKHLDILKELGHIEEIKNATGTRLVRWKRNVG